MKRIGILAIFMSFLVWSAQSYAGLSVTYTLTEDAFTIVDDAAGLWGHLGGKVFQGATHIGYYALTRRVTLGGTDPQNTAMLTMTIFFIGENPPQNITLQGSHDYGSGNYIGSVSGASAGKKKFIKATFSGSGPPGTLTIKK
ncbi:MAG TPA: hypothetical protein ACFYD6_02890 [Candidatus Brocadiia bacterium]|nr:hypothetical protein [Candidatus Brocadiales bacterium]